MPPLQKIDVHHHFNPPKFIEALEKFGSKEWPKQKWSAEDSLAVSEVLGIQTSMLSLTTPSVDVVNSLEDQLEIARDANALGAATRDAHPGRFGFFATVPNPVQYPNAALEELQRALDDEHADGVTLMTSYSGKYLGDEAFVPLWDELNRRSAVAFIHPTSPPGPYKPVNKVLLPPVLDFTFETTKTACDLIYSGIKGRFPDVKIILSHAGGNLPWIWHRPALLANMSGLTDMTVDVFGEQAKDFYFDTALTGNPDNIDLLLKFAKRGHVLYGSDFPYAPTNSIEVMTQGVNEVLDRKDEGVRDSVNSASALKLFPRLRAHEDKL